MFILNLIIDGLVLWAGTKIAPNVVQIDGFGTLVLATILLAVITLGVAFACVAVIGVSAACGSGTGIVIGIIAAFLSDVIAMALLSSWLPGFAIIGFWPKAIIAICFAIFERSNHSSD